MANAVRRGACFRPATTGRRVFRPDGLWIGLLTRRARIPLPAKYTAVSPHGIGDGLLVRRCGLLCIGNNEPLLAAVNDAGARVYRHPGHDGPPLLWPGATGQPVLHYGGINWSVFTGGSIAAAAHGWADRHGFPAGLSDRIFLQHLHAKAAAANAGGALASADF